MNMELVDVSRTSRKKKGFICARIIHLLAIMNSTMSSGTVVEKKHGEINKFHFIFNKILSFLLLLNIEKISCYFMIAKFEPMLPFLCTVFSLVARRIFLSLENI